MALYVFETISPAQALAYNALSDSLVFSEFTAGGANTRVTFNPATAGSGPTAWVSSLVRFQAVQFGASAFGEQDALYADGSKLSIGTLGVDALAGAVTNDGLFGGPGADSLNGGGGNDALNGGADADILTGGPGSDLFLVASGEAPAALGQMDTITDWQAGDFLSFSGPAATAASYAEGSAADFASALALANQQISGGVVEYVAVAIGSDVTVFADSKVNHGVAEDAVVLTGRTLADISFSNIVLNTGPAAPVMPPGTPPGTPTPPFGAASGVSAAFSGNIDAVHLSHLIGTGIATTTSTSLSLRSLGVSLDLGGFGFTYNADGEITAGTVTSIHFMDTNAGVQQFGDLIGVSQPIATLALWMLTDANALAFSTLLGGADTIGGGSFADVLRGYDGADVLYGFGGSDTMYGGAGDDSITVGVSQGGISPGPGPTYLRGDDGNDSISGGAAFDDINGNMGNDTAHGNAGDDWAVGGKDNDMLFGDAGSDVVWGNLGNDTQDGGDGNDQVRGGQGDDTIAGGAGDDYVSGDRGSDTIAGGAGADRFHGSQDAGIDRVLDFHISESDRVMLDPGTTYTLAQVGADTVIDMGGGHQMILVGVQLSTLTPGWIFGA